MERIHIYANRPLELALSTYRYILREKFHEHVDEYNYILNPETEDWVDKIDQQMSPFLRNDLQLFEQLKRSMHLMVKIIFLNQLTTVDEFLDTFQALTTTQFLQYYLECYELEWDGHKPIDFDQFGEILREHYSPEQTQFIVESLQYPQELQTKMVSSLRTFYQRFFQPIEDQTMQIIDAKIKEHYQLFADNPELFSKNILLIDLDQIDSFKTAGSLTIYASYFNEFSVRVYDLTPQDLIMVYSLNLEQRYNQELMAEKQKLLFKILSDEKRVEMLKLLAQRQWYGNELAKHFGLTTATMSYHISKLVDLGLITVTNGDQNRFYYRLRKDRLKEIFLNALQDITGEKLD